jgi:quinol monooxygenase YgiN
MDENANQEIRQLALYEVHKSAIVKVLAAIEEFVTAIRVKQPGTLFYEVWQERENPARFVHLFVFRDDAAHQAHTDAAETKKFASILYPECLEPVKFVDYHQVATNAHPSL